MILQRNVYISAQLLINEHGKKAENYAIKKMQIYIKKDDVKEASVWLSIICAIDDLNAKTKQGRLH